MEHKYDINASSSSWVAEMEKMREDANPSVEMARWNQHSIYLSAIDYQGHDQ
jgi:hypothetical protein